MSLPVYLVPTLSAVAHGGTIEVIGDEAHHAVTVRRSRVGEVITLTDGRGGQATGRIETVGKRAMSVRVQNVTRHSEPTPAIWVVQAIPKGDRGERAVEVLTEVGVARIIPWAADRSVGQWRGERAAKSLEKWRATARESSKQARRTWAAEVTPMVHTAALRDVLQGVDQVIVLHEEATQSLDELAVPAVGVIVVVVGPEGGLTEHELETFAQVGGIGVKLGVEILRTSTAGVAACAAVLSRTARWRLS